MLSTVRKHTLFVIVLVLSLVNAGIVFIAAAFTTYDDLFPDAAPSAGDMVRTNANPPPVCTVREGETLFDVADRLGIPYYDLILENRLSGEAGVMPGLSLAVPVFTEPSGSEKIHPRPEITVDSREGLAPLTATLTADTASLDPSVRFFWDLGNNRFAFSPRARARYIRPGVYHPRLVTVDASGRYVLSAPAVITVTALPASYQGLPYLTVERIGDLINVTGRLKNATGQAIDFDENGTIIQEPPLAAYFSPNTLIARRGGFSKVRLEAGDGVFEFLLFVSPLPARLSVEPEFDWYKTQFDTGMYGNCGPAAIASAIRWATGTDLTVEKIREEIGMPYANGAVDYDNLMENMALHRTRSEKQPLRGMADIFRVIDSGGLVVVSFNCGSIRPTTRDETTDFFDRYYPDATGHYLLIKGYTLDRKYFIVYDAIPGEWKDNSTRYPDGVSMIGRNRFFRAGEVMAGISQKRMIVIRREPGKEPTE